MLAVRPGTMSRAFPTVRADQGHPSIAQTIESTRKETLCFSLRAISSPIWHSPVLPGHELGNIPSSIRPSCNGAIALDRGNPCMDQSEEPVGREAWHFFIFVSGVGKPPFIHFLFCLFPRKKRRALAKSERSENGWAVKE